MATPPGIGKHKQRIRFDRLSRFFVTENEEGKLEKWYEMGHFAQGVEFKLPRVTQKDGANNFTGEILGWKAEGSFEPSQNGIPDYEFYEQHLNGKKGVAILSGDQLWLFRIRPLGANKYEDNRISLMTYPLYGGTFKKGSGEISGYITNYEFIQVKNFNVTAGGQMQYDKVSFFAPADTFSGIKKGTGLTGGGA